MAEQKPIYLNPIVRFTKIDCRDACIKAWRENNLVEFLKYFIYWHLDRDNVAKFPVPLTRYFHELTGLPDHTIRRARRLLVSRGYVRMKNQKEFVVEKYAVNKLPQTVHQEIEIPDRNLSTEERKVWEAMTKIAEHTRVHFMDLMDENEKLCQRIFDLQLENAELRGQLKEREHAEDRVICGYEQGLDKGLAIQSPNGKEVPVPVYSGKLQVVTPTTKKNDSYDISH